MERYRAFFAAISLLIALPAAHAGLNDLENTCVAKKLDQTIKVSSGGGDANVTTEKWQ